MIKKIIYKKKKSEFDRNCLKCNTLLKKGEECFYYKDDNKFLYHYCNNCKKQLLKERDLK